MIIQVISSLKATDSMIDIGSGNCQWFRYFDKIIKTYYAVEVNKYALSFRPMNEKIRILSENVFSSNFSLSASMNSKIDLALFSFFLSHFSDYSIKKILRKLKSVDVIIVIDSFWGNSHKEKHPQKELKIINRKTGQNQSIHLPKRFFEQTDIEDLFGAFNYCIDKFEIGNYWFIAMLRKKEI